jgi:hypothetical protein
MPTPITDAEVQSVLDQELAEGGTLFLSLEDRRDRWTYCSLVDRFNNPAAEPRNLPYNAEFSRFEGTTFAGVQEQLRHMKQLGAARWLGPDSHAPAQPGPGEGSG